MIYHNDARPRAWDSLSVGGHGISQMRDSWRTHITASVRARQPVKRSRGHNMGVHARSNDFKIRWYALRSSSVGWRHISWTMREQMTSYCPCLKRTGVRLTKYGEYSRIMHATCPPCAACDKLKKKLYTNYVERVARRRSLNVSSRGNDAVERALTGFVSVSEVRARLGRCCTQCIIKHTMCSSALSAMSEPRAYSEIICKSVI